jgi:hypothetical protein
MNRLTRAILENQLPTVFTSDEIRRLEPDDNVRYCQMNRAIASGDIIRIRRGFYTLNTIFRKDLINTPLLANLFQPHSYISMELALSVDFWIPEAVYMYTSATSGPSRTIKTSVGCFSYLHIPQKNLMAGVHTVELGAEPHLQAKPLKALADLIFKFRYQWTTLEPLLESLRIEMDDLETLTAADFDEIQGNYEASNVENFLAGIRKELGV